MTTTTRTAHMAVARADGARAGALDRLLDELAGLEAGGLRVPCRAGLLDPEAWVSEDEDTAAVAARACAGCPAIDACRQYVTDHPEPAGTWAGLTWQDRKQRRPKDSTMENEMAPEPSGEQIGLARDALALIRAEATGDEDGAAALIAQLLDSPESVPAVVWSLVEFVRNALQLPPMAAARFVDVMEKHLDEVGR